MERFWCKRFSDIPLILTLLIGTFAQGHNKTSFQFNHDRGRFLNMFSVVKFQNIPCIDAYTQSGTCYTKEECLIKGGKSSGLCAAGFGTCCVFTVGCEQVAKENCTYFQSSGVNSGSCRIKACKQTANICQIRLDFDTFIISGPSTTSQSSILTSFGAVNSASFGLGSSSAVTTRCLTDTFSVTNPGGITPPTICGINTGQHMFVDAADGCNDLVFQQGNRGRDTTPANRQWSIKITQISCDATNLAPSGCTQYYFGSTIGSVQSYNFDGGIHLAHQNQNICIRRERGTCKICWTASIATDFQLSGFDFSGGITRQDVCCGHGSSGTGARGFDCVTIPGALKSTDLSKPGASRICGRNNGLVTRAIGQSKTICSKRVPFSLRFLTDGFESTVNGIKSEAAQKDMGFKLYYNLDSKTC